MLKADMIKAVEAQEGLIHRYYQQNGCVCVIGALAAYKSIPIPKSVHTDNGFGDYGITSTFAYKLLKGLMNAYECDEDVLSTMQIINDDNHLSFSERKTRMLDYINRLTW